MDYKHNKSSYNNRQSPMDRNEERELLGLVDSIYANRGFRVRLQGVESLFDDKIYYEMYKIVFPGKDPEFNKLNQQSDTSVGKLEALLEHIQDRMGIDLQISAEDIVGGNTEEITHLLKFFE